MPTSPATDSPRPKANILLVDDYPANLLALEAILEPLGQNLVRTSSGEDALRWLDAEDFAVVLLDVQMQGLDGFQTAKRIRSLGKARPTPIIFLTAFESPSFPVSEAYRLGAVDYLLKPLVADILRAKVAGFVELFHSVQRAEAQAESLRQSEERYRLLVEQVRDYAIFLLDPGGHIMTWNAGAQRMKGYTAEEVIGRHFSIFYSAEDLARGKPADELRVATAEGRVEDEAWRIRKDGSRFWANGIITALRDTQGKLRGFAKVTRDLTQTVLAEERERQLVREQAAHAAAREGVLARDRFLSIASHELRTPLNPLQMNIQLLARAARDGSLHDRFADRAATILEACERQVRGFARLVNDLLDVSQIAAGRLELYPGAVDLAAVVRDVVERFRPELEQAGCALSVRADAPAVGHWDRTRLDQVVMNLLSNAAKYGRGQPIEVTVEARTESARLTVRDHGIGVAPEDRERIFQRFERAVGGHDYGGLGLGLYIVRQIVDGLHGTITVGGEPGVGSVFTVDLPYEPPTAEPGA